MRKLSVVIITFNEEQHIGRCIAAVSQLADEVIVVDSFSNDATTVIANSMGAKVIRQTFLGYVAQKNFAMAQASHNLVLSIDADEVVSKELAASIFHAKLSSGFDAYECARMANYCGQWIRHGSWYPDKKLRLFDKTKGKWIGDGLHEEWQPFEKKPAIGRLNGDLLHYTFDSISDHLKQIEKFTEIAAKVAATRGKKSSILKVWLSPKWRFFNDYILHRGFLDGYAGYIVAKYSAFATQVKYSKIRQYSAQRKTWSIETLDIANFQQSVKTRSIVAYQ